MTARCAAILIPWYHGIKIAAQHSFIFLFAVKKKVKEKRPKTILVKSLRSGFKNKILKSTPQHADSQIF